MAAFSLAIAGKLQFSQSTTAAWIAPRGMVVLSVLVDYDNVNERFKRAGAVAACAEIIRLIPGSVVAQYDAIQIRLYGGWRERGALTRTAQEMVPLIRQASPQPFSHGAGQNQKTVRLEIVMADSPIWTNRTFGESFVRDRPVRKFRARRTPWDGCANHEACGLSHLQQVRYSNACQISACEVRAQDALVRDEQKMVDTLIVADIAYLALQKRAKNLIVVSSDVDMWPGVLLAANAGCLITHVHTNQGWRTQRHLSQMLEVGRSERFYEQVSPA